MQKMKTSISTHLEENACHLNLSILKGRKMYDLKHLLSTALSKSLC